MRLHTGTVRTQKGSALKVDSGGKQNFCFCRTGDSNPRQAFQWDALPSELSLPLVGLFRQRTRQTLNRPPAPDGCIHQTGLQNSQIKTIFPNQVIVQLQLNKKNYGSNYNPSFGHSIFSIFRPDITVMVDWA